MTPTKPGDLLRKLSEKWREYNPLPSTPISETQHRCADELDYALAQLQPVMEKLVEAGAGIRGTVHDSVVNLEVLAIRVKVWDAALAEYRKVLHE